jgi:hypothetical protein
VPLGVDPWIGHDEIGCWMSMVGFETTGVARKDGRRPLTLLIVMVVVLGVPLSYFSRTKDGGPPLAMWAKAAAFVWG